MEIVYQCRLCGSRVVLGDPSIGVDSAGSTGVVRYHRCADGGKGMLEYIGQKPETVRATP